MKKNRVAAGCQGHRQTAEQVSSFELFRMFLLERALFVRPLFSDMPKLFLVAEDELKHFRGRRA